MAFTASADTGMPIRLDAFLVHQLPNESRTSVQKLIKTGCVTVNGTLAHKSGATIRGGEEVSVTPLAPVPDKYEARPVTFRTAAVHPDFIIVEKPAGLLVHHAPSSKEDDALVNGLLYAFRELDSFQDKQRPGIVHRLDKDTSGLMVVARTPLAHRTLSQLFKDRSIHKTYFAVVEGHPDRTGTIELPIGRHRHQRHKMAATSVNGRNAETHYTVLAYYKDTTLIAAFPVTGRTHQIRVHMASIGHPIIGDATYGTPSTLIDRHALHAAKLSFSYGDEEFEFHAPVPEDMRELLKALKADLNAQH